MPSLRIMKPATVVVTVLCFLVQTLLFATPAHADILNSLPLPGMMVRPSDPFVPVLLRGLTLHPEDPMRFDFIVDSGDSKAAQDEVQQESQKLVKYFMAALTVPEEDLWVNLSPLQKDEIITDDLSRTELGRDLLAQDYLLKQITASLMYPEDEFGAKLWERIYDKAAKEFGRTDIPVDTFNKVWIMPESAGVYEHNGTVYITRAKLKVMLEEDYLTTQGHKTVGTGRDLSEEDPSRELTRQIVREIVIPEIEKEVNTGEHFALLRQIYYSLILAKWYKQVVQQGLLRQLYVNKNKVAGIDLADPKLKNVIYDRYMDAYKKGVFNYIKEDYDKLTHQTIPRKYFSGGFEGRQEIPLTSDRAVRLKTGGNGFSGKGFTLAIMLATAMLPGSPAPAQEGFQEREAIKPYTEPKISEENLLGGNEGSVVFQERKSIEPYTEPEISEKNLLGGNEEGSVVFQERKSIEPYTEPKISEENLLGGNEGSVVVQERKSIKPYTEPEISEENLPVGNEGSVVVRERKAIKPYIEPKISEENLPVGNVGSVFNDLGYNYHKYNTLDPRKLTLGAIPSLQRVADPYRGQSLQAATDGWPSRDVSWLWPLGITAGAAGVYFVLFSERGLFGTKRRIKGAFGILAKFGGKRTASARPQGQGLSPDAKSLLKDANVTPDQIRTLDELFGARAEESPEGVRRIDSATPQDQGLSPSAKWVLNTMKVTPDQILGEFVARAEANPEYRIYFAKNPLPKFPILPALLDDVSSVDLLARLMVVIVTSKSEDEESIDAKSVGFKDTFELLDRVKSKIKTQRPDPAVLIPIYEDAMADMAGMSESKQSTLREHFDDIGTFPLSKEEGRRILESLLDKAHHHLITDDDIMDVVEHGGDVDVVYVEAIPEITAFETSPVTITGVGAKAFRNGLAIRLVDLSNGGKMTYPINEPPSDSVGQVVAHQTGEVIIRKGRPERIIVKPRGQYRQMIPESPAIASRNSSFSANAGIVSASLIGLGVMGLPAAAYGMTAASAFGSMAALIPADWDWVFIGAVVLDVIFVGYVISRWWRQRSTINENIRYRDLPSKLASSVEDLKRIRDGLPPRRDRKSEIIRLQGLLRKNRYNEEAFKALFLELKHHDPASMSLVKPFLGNPSAKTRSQARWILEKRMNAKPSELVDGYVDVLKNHQSSGDAREEAIWHLQRLADERAIPELLPELEYPDHRKAIGNLLVKLGATREALLMGYLAAARYDAETVSGDIKEKEEERVGLENRILHVIARLVELGDDRAVPYLMPFLSWVDFEPVKTAAEDALRPFPSEVLLKAYSEIAGGEDAEIVLSALLELISGQRQGTVSVSPEESIAIANADVLRQLALRRSGKDRSPSQSVTDGKGAKKTSFGDERGSFMQSLLWPIGLSGALMLHPSSLYAATTGLAVAGSAIATGFMFVGVATVTVAVMLVVAALYYSGFLSSRKLTARQFVQDYQPLVKNDFVYGGPWRRKVVGTYEFVVNAKKTGQFIESVQEILDSSDPIEMEVLLKVAEVLKKLPIVNERRIDPEYIRYDMHLVPAGDQTVARDDFQPYKALRSLFEKMKKKVLQSERLVKGQKGRQGSSASASDTKGVVTPSEEDHPAIVVGDSIRLPGPSMTGKPKKPAEKSKSLPGTKKPAKTHLAPAPSKKGDSQSPDPAQDLGGIDMTAIGVDRSGAGVDEAYIPALPLSDTPTNLDVEPDGFVPVFINFTPLDSVLPILGLNADGRPADVVSAASSGRNT